MRIDLLCLDICSGLGGFSAPFAEAGFEVVTVDIERSFRPTIQADASKLPLRDGLEIDMIVASPPCEKFSVMSIGRYWKDGRPGKEAAQAGNLVKGILEEIYRLNPKWWVMENPDAMLKRIIGRPQWIITLCQYGTTYQKRTALWGRLPGKWVPKKCKNESKCHEAAPRGFKGGGLQDVKGSALRAKLPPGLGKSIIEAIRQ